MSSDAQIDGGNSGLVVVPEDATSAQSRPFIGKWNRLISATNWEKGKIIHGWRTKLAESGAAAETYSDDSWSRIVGDVTPQHVSRLRRTYARYSRVYRDYAGLYWSHFYAALDWEDAEMWLEGAVQNRWSVSQMRQARWEATTGARQLPIADAAVDLAEFADGLGLLHNERDVRPNSRETIDGPIYEATNTELSRATPSDVVHAAVTTAHEPHDPIGGSPPADAYAIWEELPDDLARIAEDFKLAALRYKLNGWQEFSKAQMRRLLDSLIVLIESPST